MLYLSPISSTSGATNGGSQMITIREYATGKTLAEISAKDLNKWCAAHGYLPHHKFARGWVVI